MKKDEVHFIKTGDFIINRKNFKKARFLNLEYAKVNQEWRDRTVKAWD